MGEFRPAPRYRLSLIVGGYRDGGQFITAHMLEVDASEPNEPVSPAVRAGLVEKALSVLLSEREAKAA